MRRFGGAAVSFDDVSQYQKQKRAVKRGREVRVTLQRSQMTTVWGDFEVSRISQEKVSQQLSEEEYGVVECGFTDSRPALHVQVRKQSR